MLLVTFIAADDLCCYPIFVCLEPELATLLLLQHVAYSYSA